MKLWIARDKKGDLFLYREEPFRYNDVVFDTIGVIGPINPYLFSEVTWENSPQEVELKLIKEMKDFTLTYDQVIELLDYVNNRRDAIGSKKFRDIIQEDMEEYEYLDSLRDNLKNWKDSLDEEDY